MGIAEYCMALAAISQLAVINLYLRDILKELQK